MKTIIIGLSGKKRTGKNLAANFMFNFNYLQIGGIEPIIDLFSFAEPLKEVACKLWDLTLDQLENNKENIIEKYNQSPRTLMQGLGCKLREIYPNTWVDLCFKSIDEIE